MVQVGKNSLKSIGVATELLTAITVLGDEVSHSLTMIQVRCFLRVAAAGDVGIEVERLTAELAREGEDVPSALMSKSISVLSDDQLDYTKKRPGFGLVTRMLNNPMDQRRKAVVLTAKGKQLAKKMAEAVEKFR